MAIPKNLIPTEMTPTAKTTICTIMTTTKTTTVLLNMTTHSLVIKPTLTSLKNLKIIIWIALTVSSIKNLSTL